MTERVDLAILGGGLAGLSLAQRLAHAGAGGVIRILEPREAYTDDRSWAFWMPTESRWAKTAARTWTHWRCNTAADGEGVVASAEGWRYAYLRSSAVYDEALNAIARHPRIQIERGVQAGTITREADGLAVSTNVGTLLAQQVVDTRPPSRAQLAGSRLFQCFAGRELQLEDPGIADDAIELMTDMRVDHLGFVFSYVLPLSPTRVLVEATRFSRQPLSAAVLSTDLDALLASRGWRDAPVLRSEYAVLPMGLPRAPHTDALPGVVRAGTAAGALRAASGYGFLRIQAWADRCAEAIAQNGKPLGHPEEPHLRRWMDAVFLNALIANPERAPDFFLRLARLQPSAAFARFMSDQATAADVLRVITALPAGPFLRALRSSPAAESRAA